MKRLLALGLALCLMMAAPGARAGEPADGIQAVIADQLAAFGRDDFAEAFTHASPGIQRIFETPERFGQMVRNGYPMVWRPARWEWRGLVETGSGPVQVVLFEDRAGQLHEAGYLMEQIDGLWRIAGVKLRRLDGTGT